MKKEELQISIIVLWYEAYNKNNKLTPEILDFSVEKKTEFLEEVTNKTHLQVMQVPVSFFTMEHEKQVKLLKKLADLSKIEKFKTVADLIKELQESGNPNALVKILYYAESDDECHYSPVTSFDSHGYKDCFEIEEASYYYN